MFNTHPHYKYIRQKPSCSTLPKAEPIHKSPAIDSARRRLHTTSSAHELLQVGTQGRSYSAKYTKAHRFQKSPPPTDLYCVTCPYTESNTFLCYFTWRDHIL